MWGSGPLCELLFEADMDRSPGFCSQPRLLPSEPGGAEGGGHPCALRTCCFLLLTRGCFRKELSHISFLSKQQWAHTRVYLWCVRETCPTSCRGPSVAGVSTQSRVRVRPCCRRAARTCWLSLDPEVLTSKEGVVGVWLEGCVSCWPSAPREGVTSSTGPRGTSCGLCLVRPAGRPGQSDPSRSPPPGHLQGPESHLDRVPDPCGGPARPG